MSLQRVHSRRRRLAVAAIVASTALATAAATVEATPPGVNGRIAFMRDTGHLQIWTSNPDLSAAVQITSEDADSGFAVWSPDGKRLAFDSTRSDLDPDDGSFINDVFLMDADGSNVSKLSESAGFSGEPAWSPDGTWIAFSSDRGVYPPQQAIYVIRPDGTGMRRVTALPPTTSWQGSPRFSPDGRKLVFTEFRSGNILKNRREGAMAGATSALFTINVDGTGLRQITPWGNNAGDADWSPDGKRLVFETVFAHIGNMASVYVVDADGQHLTNLTHDKGITGTGNFDALRLETSFDPVWSPDGSKILYSRDLLTAAGEFTTGLQTMNPDGSGAHYVSSVLGAEHQADWGIAPLQ